MTLTLIHDQIQAEHEQAQVASLIARAEKVDALATPVVAYVRLLLSSLPITVSAAPYWDEANSIPMVRVSGHVAGRNGLAVVERSISLDDPGHIHHELAAALAANLAHQAWASTHDPSFQAAAQIIIDLVRV